MYVYANVRMLAHERVSNETAWKLISHCLFRVLMMSVQVTSVPGPCSLSWAGLSRLISCSRFPTVHDAAGPLGRAREERAPSLLWQGLQSFNLIAWHLMDGIRKMPLPEGHDDQVLMGDYICPEDVSFIAPGVTLGPRMGAIHHGNGLSGGHDETLWSLLRRGDAWGVIFSVYQNLGFNYPFTLKTAISHYINTIFGIVHCI